MPITHTNAKGKTYYLHQGTTKMGKPKFYCSMESTEVLLIEYALSSLLQPTASADWGYRLARQYAERYDAHYETGLIPASAPMVEDIADFWCQYHLGKP